MMENKLEGKESTAESDAPAAFITDSLLPSSTVMPPAGGSVYHPLDTIFLNNLQLSAVIGPDAWNRPERPQPIILSLQLQIDRSSADDTVDDIRNTFSYSQICKDVMALLKSTKFWGIDHLTSELAGLAESWPGEALKVQALAPKGILRVERGFGREFSLKRIEAKTKTSDIKKTFSWHVESHEWFIKGLKLACTIGVNPHEWREKQNISIDIRIQGEAQVSDYTLQIKDGTETWRQLVKRVCEVGSLEARAYRIHKR